MIRIPSFNASTLLCGHIKQQQHSSWHFLRWYQTASRSVINRLHQWWNGLFPNNREVLTQRCPPDCVCVCDCVCVFFVFFLWAVITFLTLCVALAFGSVPDLLIPIPVLRKVWIRWGEGADDSFFFFFPSTPLPLCHDTQAREKGIPVFVFLSGGVSKGAWPVWTCQSGPCGRHFLSSRDFGDLSACWGSKR